MVTARGFRSTGTGVRSRGTVPGAGKVMYGRYNNVQDTTESWHGRQRNVQDIMAIWYEMTAMQLDSDKLLLTGVISNQYIMQILSGNLDCGSVASPVLLPASYVMLTTLVLVSVTWMVALLPSHLICFVRGVDDPHTCICYLDGGTVTPHILPASYVVLVTLMLQVLFLRPLNTLTENSYLEFGRRSSMCALRSVELRYLILRLLLLFIAGA